MPWLKRAMQEERCGIFRNSSFMARVRKIAEFSKGTNEIRPAQTQLQCCGAVLDLCHKLTAGGKGKCLLFKEHSEQLCSPDHKTDRSPSLPVQFTAY